MLAFRFCVVVSAGAVMVLGCGEKAFSQDVAPYSESASLEQSNVEQAIAPMPEVGKDTKKIESPSPAESVSPLPVSGGNTERMVGDSQPMDLPATNPDSRSATEEIADSVFPPHPSPILENQRIAETDEPSAVPQAETIVVAGSMLPDTETVLEAFTEVVASPEVQQSAIAPSEQVVEPNVPTTDPSETRRAEISRILAAASASLEQTPIPSPARPSTVEATPSATPSVQEQRRAEIRRILAAASASLERTPTPQTPEEAIAIIEPSESTAIPAARRAEISRILAAASASLEKTPIPQTSNLAVAEPTPPVQEQKRVAASQILAAASASLERTPAPQAPETLVTIIEPSESAAIPAAKRAEISRILAAASASLERTPTPQTPEEAIAVIELPNVPTAIPEPRRVEISRVLAAASESLERTPVPSPPIVVPNAVAQSTFSNSRSESVVARESSLPNPQTIIDVFKTVVTDFSAVGNSSRSEENTAAIPTPAPLERQKFSPFERILSQFNATTATATNSASEPETPIAISIPVPAPQERLTPFERILSQFSQVTAPNSTPELAPAIAAANTNSPDSEPDVQIPAIAEAASSPEQALEINAPIPNIPTLLASTLPNPQSVLEAFKATIEPLETNASVAPQITDPPVSAQNPSPATIPVETAPGSNNPISAPEQQDPNQLELLSNPQPAAVLEEVKPPEYLNPSGDTLLFPTETDEVAIDISQPITLEQAIELARRNNPTLRSTRIELEGVREGLREALAAEYPTLSTQFDFTRSDSAQQELANQARNSSSNANSNLLGLAGLSGNNNDTITTSADARLELSYNLYTGGRRSAQIEASAEQVRLNQLEVERVSEQIRFETTRTYYNLQEADARVFIEEAAVVDASQSLRDAELLEEAGLGTKFDVLQAQVQLKNSEQNLRNAISQQQTSRRELATLLGVGQQVEVTVADEIEAAGSWDLSLEETILLAYRNRAELEQQLVQRNISEQQRRIALADIKPQLSLFANYNFLGVLDDGQGLADGYTFGARLQWTLFDGGAARARAAREEKNIELAETRFDEQRNQVRLEVEQAYYSLKANEENIQTASVALELAQETLRLARLRFGAGVGTQTEVINAQSDLTRARGNLLTAIITYNRDLAALQRAVTNLPDNRLFDLP